jgi:uncharacterized protein (TIGR00255 family)
LSAAEAAAAEAGLDLRPVTAADVVHLQAARPAGDGPGLDVLAADLSDLVAAFEADRAREGAALAFVLASLVDEIEALVTAAAELAPRRADHQAEMLGAAIGRLAGIDLPIDEDRVSQEVALLAAKADVTEEIDRLTGHLAAARLLLDASGPVGRRLDFLTQEFMREANTLCAKSALPELTTIGLDLKAAIDRLREQVQNIE